MANELTSLIQAENQPSRQTAPASSDRNQIADKDTFLKLFTTQLENQNPLDPKKGTKMLEQLATFSSVEQMSKTNENVSKILENMGQDNIRQRLQFIGKRVSGPGNSIGLQGEEAKINYSLGSEADSVEVRVKRPNGETVATLDGDKGSGSHTLTWDGKGDDGEDMPDGRYQFEVVAKDANGDPVTTSTETTGIVQQVQMQAGEAYLELTNGARIKPDEVVSVERVTSDGETA